jgi:hypothetical protein
MWEPKAFMATVTRIYCTMMLGTWFFHASFILYLPTPFPGIINQSINHFYILRHTGNRANPKWDHHSDSNTHFLVALFGYYAIFNLVVLTLGYVIVFLILKLFFKSTSKSAANGNIPLLGTDGATEGDFDL